MVLLLFIHFVKMTGWHLKALPVLGCFPQHALQNTIQGYNNYNRQQLQNERNDNTSTVARINKMIQCMTESNNSLHGD